MATDLATYLNTQTKSTASDLYHRTPVPVVTEPKYSFIKPLTDLNFLIKEASKYTKPNYFYYIPGGDYFNDRQSGVDFGKFDINTSFVGLAPVHPRVKTPSVNDRRESLAGLENLYKLYQSTGGKTNSNSKYAITYDPTTKRWAYSYGVWAKEGEKRKPYVGAYVLPAGMGFDTYLNYLKTGKLSYTPTTPTDPETPTDPVVPTNPTDPAIDELRKIIEELKKQIADNQASVEAEKKRIEAEKQARIANRTQALQEAGLWDLVRQLYGDNTSDLNAYLDTGVFSRQTGLEDWASQNLTRLSESLNKQYADAMKQLQQKAAAAGFGDASWIKGAETALRGQQRGLADVYGSAYDAAALASLLGMDPAYIRGKPWVAPQSITDYGQGFDAFAALDPTLSRLIPGGIDERETPWITTEYKKRDPWSAIFNREDEENRLSGFIRELLHSGRR